MGRTYTLAPEEEKLTREALYYILGAAYATNMQGFALAALSELPAVALVRVVEGRPCATPEYMAVKAGLTCLANELDRLESDGTKYRELNKVLFDAHWTQVHQIIEAE